MQYEILRGHATVCSVRSYKEVHIWYIRAICCSWFHCRLTQPRPIVQNMASRTNCTANWNLLQQKVQIGMWAHRRRRSACASAQSDLSLRWALYGYQRAQRCAQAENCKTDQTVLMTRRCTHASILSYLIHYTGSIMTLKPYVYVIV